MCKMERIMLDLNFPPPAQWSPEGVVPYLSPPSTPPPAAPESAGRKDGRNDATAMETDIVTGSSSLSPPVRESDLETTNLTTISSPELDLEAPSNDGATPVVPESAVLEVRNAPLILPESAVREVINAPLIVPDSAVLEVSNASLIVPDTAVPDEPGPDSAVFEVSNALLTVPHLHDHNESNADMRNAIPSAANVSEQVPDKMEIDSPSREVMANGAVTDAVSSPQHDDAVDDAQEDVPAALEDFTQNPRSVEGVDSNLTEEVSNDRGGPVKVRKRLKTIGQILNLKEKDAAAAIPEDPRTSENLEDEIVSVTRARKTSLPPPTRLSRIRKGEQGALVSNGGSTTGRNAPNSQAGEGDESKSSRAESGDLPFFIGRGAKIPSQPRSRKPEKRPNLSPPVVVPKVSPEAQPVIADTTENDENENRAEEQKKGADVPNVDQSAAEEQKKDIPQSIGVKRPGVGLKDAMQGKKRRQIVCLAADESLKQARPLRTPTSEGAGGRVQRYRRETSRTSLTQVSEKQESEVNESASSSVPMKASTSSKPEDTEDPSKLERNMKPLVTEGAGQFRRPGLKRQTSAAFARDETSAMGVRTELAETRKFGMSSEGQESQKARRIPRKTEVKKPTPAVQDASVERLHREVTSSKLWQTAGTSDLQQVPGSFDSVDDYVRVLEPLLFEECRAQLHSSWEELLDGSVRDAHIPVIIKGVDRRERGWYDVVVLSENQHVKFKFKEGDVAVLSTPKPGSGGKFKGRMKAGSIKEKDGMVVGRLTGIVRRYNPIDVRDPPGAVLHFHVSQEDASGSSAVDPTTINGNVMEDLRQQGVTWYLTVLGGVTTSQREYIALHYLQQFNPKMLKAVLHPRPELFPGYAGQDPPAMPECFTGAFVQHLHGHFNAPQLAAIQWAGAHTAAGSGSSVSTGGVPKQEPWPFTLVQGPPGTGKTHTVWGMLNVIHLVQYQRYYQALLKTLAPSSVAPEETPSSNLGGHENGSIDDVLQKMDDSLARMLPKLCPKPRMLVCAPSNAATDELLSRVLDRGFIDGEMKVYRPDVARVGSDPNSRAAQAVSVERRSEQLLGMGREQVKGWLQQLRGKDLNCSQVIACLQRDLNEVANIRSQGNLGIDPEKLAARDQARDTKLQQLAAQVEERDKILVEMNRLLLVEAQFRPGSTFSRDDARHKLEASFANEAEIVFTTVSSSGRRIFTKLTHGFDMVVIDEAAQASEVAVLPPLSLRAARCVLVGDPQQLPATVISRVADTMQYSRSLFERFQQAGCPAILLSVQYRMHPQIRDFPSRYFYQGRLVDSDSVKDKLAEVYHKDPLLQPYLFYDISQGRESHGGSVSYQNKLEAQVAVKLYLHLQKAMAVGGIPNVSVGMITPYKQQLRCLQTEFEALVGSKADAKGVYINTVDAFQGQERDVIIMSCVRASSHGVGFVADIRRMNVALTRARRSLWVIGNATALNQSEDWAALLSDAKVRGSIVDTSMCISGGLLPDDLSAPQVLPSAHPGMLRQGRLEGPPSGRMEPNFGQGGFNAGPYEHGRPQDDMSMRGGVDRTWPGSVHRGSRVHRDGGRGGFGQRSLHPGRSFSRGGPFRRGRS